MPIFKEEPKLFNPKEAFVKLSDKEFTDELEAKIALAEFKQMTNAFGNRGRFSAFVRKSINTDGKEVYRIVIC